MAQNGIRSWRGTNHLQLTGVDWITLKTTSNRWEAEMMQQMLAAHEIPARIIQQGVLPHFGCSTPAALQVHRRDQWTALLLLSPIEEKEEF